MAIERDAHIARLEGDWVSHCPATFGAPVRRARDRCAQRRMVRPTARNETAPDRLVSGVEIMVALAALVLLDIAAWRPASTRASRRPERWV